MAKKKKTKKEDKGSIFFFIVSILGLLSWVVYWINYSSNLHPPEYTTSTEYVSSTTSQISQTILTRNLITQANILIEVASNEQAEYGSGVVINQDDYYYYAITCYHVVDLDDANSYMVKTSDFIQSGFVVVAMDESNDLALIKFSKVNRDDITPLSMNTDTLTGGETLISIGNPNGYFGIIQYINYLESITIQELENSREMILLDSALQSGMSGGALVNPLGQLVGINAAVLDGQTYSIPASIIHSFLQNITY